MCQINLCKQNLILKLLLLILNIRSVVPLKEYICIHKWCLLRDGRGLGSPWGQREGYAPVSPLQNCHFWGHPTCPQVLLFHSLPFTWVTKNLPAPPWKPMAFTKTSQQGPNKGKLKQKENITFVSGPFCEPYCLQRQFRKLLWIDFSMGKRTKEIKTLRRRQARQRRISHLAVLSFSTVQKSISDEFLWKLLKQCYFIKDRCQRHQICFPGVN